MGVVVYVHGVGSKAEPADLKRHWDVALFGTDVGPLSRLAYWADLRFWDRDGAAETEEELELVLLEYQGDTRGFIDLLVAQIAGEPVEDEGRLWLERAVMELLMASVAETPSELAPMLDHRWWRTPIFWAFVRIWRRWLVDAYQYFFGGQADSIWARLREQMEQRDDVVAVVGHSLGSVICYDVLRSMQAIERESLSFVSVGSPLGVSFVQDVVVQPLYVPERVGEWHHVNDPRDRVAGLDPTIEGEFTPSHRTWDHTVANDADRHHHAVSGYLSTAPVRSVILPLVGPGDVQTS